MYEPDFASIGKRIRTRRRALGLTQEEVADAANVNVSHISNIENNKVKVSLSLLIRICQILDTTVDYILANELPKSSGATDRELIRIISEMPQDKKETLLRIANVL